MTRRRGLVVASALGLLLAQAGRAQGLGAGRRRLGVLLFDGPESWRFLEPELRKALAELGWVEGSNLSVEWRYAGGDSARLAALAASMAAAGFDAIITRGTPATRALQRATRAVPILTGVGDPVGSGFAASLARPGSNITGVSYAAVETSRKSLELLRELRPPLSRLAVLLAANRQPYMLEITGALESAARELAIEPRLHLVATPDDVRRALQSVPRAETDAAYLFNLSFVDPKAIARHARDAGVPTMFEHPLFVEAGGLMSYRLYWQDQTQRTAVHVDKVFRGASPAQIPFELPTRSELVIHTGTARALGLVVPRALLARADRLIE